MFYGRRSGRMPRWGMGSPATLLGRAPIHSWMASNAHSTSRVSAGDRHMGVLALARFTGPVRVTCLCMSDGTYGSGAGPAYMRQAAGGTKAGSPPDGANGRRVRRRVAQDGCDAPLMRLVGPCGARPAPCGAIVARWGAAPQAVLGPGLLQFRNHGRGQQTYSAIRRPVVRGGAPGCDGRRDWLARIGRFAAPECPAIGSAPVVPVSVRGRTLWQAAAFQNIGAAGEGRKEVGA
jgi:hypothetical protein